MLRAVWIKVPLAVLICKVSKIRSFFWSFFFCFFLGGGSLLGLVGNTFRFNIQHENTLNPVSFYR